MLGLTVRNVTFDVRRYFKMKADDPGVVISKIEQGSKASVAGLKPYEIITQINDQPVRTVAEFQKLTEKGDAFRISVKNMISNRVVEIKVNGSGGKPVFGPRKEE
jgi:serine protease Do